MRAVHRLVARTLACTVLVASGPAAAAPTRAACMSAYTGAQQQRAQHRLVAARDQLVACAQAACPELVRTDCFRWLGEVERDLPTLVVQARDGAGVDIIDARLFVDGELASPRLDGKAIMVDPGEHVLRIEKEGSPPVERRVAVAEGEHGRVIALTLSGAPVAPAPPPVAAVPAPPVQATGPREPDARAVPLGVFVLGGLGVVAAGVFAYFGTSGWNDLGHLRDTCAPKCNPASVDHARTQLQIGDVALATGIASLAVAGVWFLVSRGDAHVTAVIRGDGGGMVIPF